MYPFIIAILPRNRKCAVSTFMEKKTTASKIKGMINSLEKQKNIISEFDEELCFAVIDRVIVKVNGNLVFRFKNGSECIETSK